MPRLAVKHDNTSPGKLPKTRRLVRGKNGDGAILTSKVMDGIDTRTIGVPVLSKGMYGHYPVVMWDAVNTCRGLSCTLGSNCSYFIARGGITTGYKCDLEVRYLAYVFDTIMAVTPKGNMTAEIMHTVGLFIVPLYHHLIKFKKAEYGLRGVVDGLGKVSPIYKEIREIMKTIRGMMADLAERTGGGLDAREAADVVDAALLYGDPDYYDKMSSAVDACDSAGS